MSDEPRDVSRVRQEIIDNANTSRTLKERERRIDAKRARLKREYELIKKHRRANPVEQVDDGNIRVTIYIPRFIRNIIISFWFLWFGAFPAILILWSDSPGNIVYVPVFLLIGVLWLFLTMIGWYLYWWFLAIGSTISIVLVVIFIYTGAIELSLVRDAVQSVLK